MNIAIQNHNQIPVAILTDSAMVISDLDDALDVLANASYQGASRIIIRTEQITPDFFKLRTRLAGEILQKFSNYRMKLAVVGDFSVYSGKSLRDFIYESNRTGHIHFVSSMDEALSALCKK